MQIMIDIETLGTTPDAVILQIGAVAFPVGLNESTHMKTLRSNSSELSPLFSTNIILPNQVQEYGRVIDDKTLVWWKTDANPGARKAVFNQDGAIILPYALGNLNDFIAQWGNDITVWANSPSFDLVILRHAMTHFSIRPEWEYYEEADVRTLKRICENIGYDWKDLPVGVDMHNGLTDAKHQATNVKSFLEWMRPDESE